MLVFERRALHYELMNQTVLLVSSFLSTSLGIRCVSEDLAVRLNAADWKVLATSNYPGRLLRIADMGLTAWRKRHEYKVAQVAVFSGPAFIWAELICQLLRLMRKPYLLTLHGGNLPNFARRWPRRVRNLLNSAAVVTTPSLFLLEEMAPYRRDLLLIPNPLALEAYDFHPRTQPAPKLMWLRSFHTIYNPALALRTLAQLTQEFPDVHLTMIGPDKGDGSVQHVQHVANELALSPRLTLPGGVPKSEIAQHLNQGDIFLNTTNIDNTPVSVIEAMACGLCIVSTNVGGIPYLLEHEHDALLVPPDDPAAMAAAVRRILTEPQLAKQLSHNARHKAERFDWAVILPQWERLLQDAMESKPPSTH